MAIDRFAVGNGRIVRDPTFTQQGQVDWVAFGRTINEASLAVMQRLAAARNQYFQEAHFKGPGLMEERADDLKRESLTRMQDFVCFPVSCSDTS